MSFYELTTLITFYFSLFSIYRTQIEIKLSFKSESLQKLLK